MASTEFSDNIEEGQYGEGMMYENDEYSFNGSNNTHPPIPLHMDNIYPREYAVPINGYLSPVLIFVTLVTNIFVVIVLLRKHMRSPTNTILAGMALSDMFTGLFPLPVFINFFSLGKYAEWVDFNWCYVYYALGEWIPTIFHTASIWLTMTLAIQRYIYICHSFQARRFCTIRNVVIGTAVIYFIAILSQLSRFVENDIVPVSLPSETKPNETVVGCSVQPKLWVQKYEVVYYNIYYWFRVIFIHLIPCTFLVLLNALLISTMRTAQLRRMQLLQQNKKSESKKLKDSNCTTLMLVAVVGLFLLVEFPLGIIMILNIIQNSFENVVICHPVTFQTMYLISNFFILLSYPLNFFIYCGMSRQFRETFKHMFTGGPIPMDRDCSQYTAVPTENGKTLETAGGETAL